MATLTTGATWQVQEAKNKFSELLDRACTHGEQIITRHGKAIARVLPFNALAVARNKKEETGKSLVALMQSCPVYVPEIFETRDREDFGRDVDFGFAK
jgi:antitoxin Phd